MSALQHFQAAQIIQLGLTYRWSWTSNAKNILFILYDSIILTLFFVLYLSSKPFLSQQEMLAIMKSIYDMMGRYTYPCVRDEAPYEHVDKFFQVKTAQTGNERQMFCFVFLIPVLFPPENG